MLSNDEYTLLVSYLCRHLSTATFGFTLDDGIGIHNAFTSFKFEQIGHRHEANWLLQHCFVHKR